MMPFSRLATVAVLGLSLSACNNSQDRVPGLLTEAKSLQEQGDYKKAEAQLRTALRIAPANGAVNYELAKIEDKAGDLESAMPHYLRAALPENHILDAQLRVSEVLIDVNQLSEALGYVNRTLGTFPGNADALAMKADIEGRLGQTTAAVADAAAALQRDPANPRALSIQALAQLKNNNPSAALALVDGGLAKHADDLRLLQVRAAIMLTLKQPDQAATAFEAIVRQDPRNVLAQRALAEIEAKGGHFDEALAKFKKAIALDPGNEAMQLGLIGFLRDQDKNQDLVARLNQLVTEFPKLATYDFALAEVYRQKGDSNAVKGILTKAADRLGDTAPGLTVKVALAKLAFAAGQVNEAEDRVRAVLAVDARNRDALLLRATIAISNNTYGAAITDLLEVVRNYPTDGLAFQLLSTAYMASGQPALALDSMRRAVSVAPGNAGPELSLAALLQTTGNSNDAKTIVDQVLARRPLSTDAWAASGKLAVARQDWGTASRAAQKLRDLNDEADATLLDANVKLGNRDFVGASTLFQKAIDGGMTLDPALLGGFARASVGGARIDEAVKVLSDHARGLANDKQQEIWTMVMAMQADAGHVDRARDAFDKAVPLNPKATDPYVNFASILMARGGADQAMAVVNAGLAAGAAKAPLLIAKGGIEEQQHNYSNALASYKAALDADPQSIRARNNYASLLADIRPEDSAALTVERDILVASDRAKDPMLVDTIAWLDYRLKRFAEAKLLLTSIQASTSTNPQIRFHMAAVLIATGNKSEGLALLNSVKGETFPGSSEIATLSAT